MITGELKVKPLSVNRAWKGKRFKTAEYQDFETECLMLLKRFDGIQGKLQVYFRFGFSNPNQDFDSPVKPFTDILQKKYEFNDNRIYRAVIEKDIVPKGKEYIYFEINKLKQ